MAHEYDEEMGDSWGEETPIQDNHVETSKNFVIFELVERNGGEVHDTLERVDDPDDAYDQAQGENIVKKAASLARLQEIFNNVEIRECLQKILKQAKSDADGKNFGTLVKDRNWYSLLECLMEDPDGPGLAEFSAKLVEMGHPQYANALLLVNGGKKREWKLRFPDDEACCVLASRLAKQANDFPRILLYLLDTDENPKFPTNIEGMKLLAEALAKGTSPEDKYFDDCIRVCRAIPLERFYQDSDLLKQYVCALLKTNQEKEIFALFSRRDLTSGQRISQKIALPSLEWLFQRGKYELVLSIGLLLINKSSPSSLDPDFACIVGQSLNKTGDSEAALKLLVGFPAHPGCTKVLSQVQKMRRVIKKKSQGPIVAKEGRA